MIFVFFICFVVLIIIIKINLLNLIMSLNGLLMIQKFELNFFSVLFLLIQKIVLKFLFLKIEYSNLFLQKKNDYL